MTGLKASLRTFGPKGYHFHLCHCSDNDSIPGLRNSDTLMGEKRMKSYSTSLAIKDMEIETTMICHFITTRMAIIKTKRNTRKQNTDCWLP